MNKKFLYALWGGLFAICAGLGFVQEPVPALKVLMVMLSIGFFVPGFLLLKLSRNEALLVRNLAGLSLLVTLVLLICNFLSILGSEALGNVLHYMLIILSAPMVCCGAWGLSLFLWACLLFTAQKKLKN